jgi:hypothetical protein
MPSPRGQIGVALGWRLDLALEFRDSRVIGRLKKNVKRFDKPVLSCVEGLSVNGISSIISNLYPFVPSINSGQTLSLSKDSERVFHKPASSFIVPSSPPR